MQKLRKGKRLKFDLNEDIDSVVAKNSKKTKKVDGATAMDY